MGMLMDAETMSIQQFAAFALVAIVCLTFGTLGRLAAFDPQDEKFKNERRKSVMLLGTLYVMSLMTAEAVSANIFVMGGIAVAYGLAGPLIVKPVIEWLMRIIALITPGEKPSD